MTRKLASLVGVVGVVLTAVGCGSSSQKTTNVPLVIDSLNDPGLPGKFRIAAPNQPSLAGKSLNLTGLAELRESGSNAFSAAGLQSIKQKLNTTPVVDVDLRQETHLYVNGVAVSWFGENDDANIGMSRDQVFADEAAKKAELIRDTSIRFGYIAKKSVQPTGTVGNPKVVQTEQEVATAAGFGYFRLTVPDHHRPQNEEVDRFLAFVRDLPPGTWVHFHCRAGKGRTTTFMAMYDMARNAKAASIDDIMQRQIAIGGNDLLAGDGKSDDNKAQRVQFLRDFYDYAKSNQDGFRTSFSAWLAARH